MVGDPDSLLFSAPARKRTASILSPATSPAPGRNSIKPLGVQPAISGLTGVSAVCVRVGAGSVLATCFAGALAGAGAERAGTGRGAGAAATSGSAIGAGLRAMGLGVLA